MDSFLKIAQMLSCLDLEAIHLWPERVLLQHTRAHQALEEGQGCYFGGPNALTPLSLPSYLLALHQHYNMEAQCRFTHSTMVHVLIGLHSSKMTVHAPRTVNAGTWYISKSSAAVTVFRK